jgi:bifunctional DNA-binding transcriptional regulator/antitoxin component of YhaV-PrlF toxin-antitoxin module
MSNKFDWMPSQEEVVTVTKKGQATIPKSMRVKHRIGRKVLAVDVEQGVMLMSLPDL